MSTVVGVGELDVLCRCAILKVGPMTTKSKSVDVARKIRIPVCCLEIYREFD